MLDSHVRSGRVLEDLLYAGQEGRADGSVDDPEEVEEVVEGQERHRQLQEPRGAVALLVQRQHAVQPMDWMDG